MVAVRGPNVAHPLYIHTYIHTKSSWRSLIPFLLSHSTADFRNSYLRLSSPPGFQVIQPQVGPQHRSPVPSNGRPLLLRIRWKLFTKSLLSNGHARTYRKHLLQKPILLLRACIAGVDKQWVYSIVGCLSVVGLFTE
jgi:hypothetical protein